jgi:hypothetical protein
MGGTAYLIYRNIKTLSLFKGAEEFTVILEHLGHSPRTLYWGENNASDPWTYLDIEPLEIVESSHRSGDTRWTYPSQHQPFVFQPYQSYIPMITQDLMYDIWNRPQRASLPKVQIGLVMPASKVKGTLKLAKERQRKQGALALVRMLLSKLRRSRGYSIFGYDVDELEGDSSSEEEDLY